MRGCSTVLARRVLAELGKIHCRQKHVNRRNPDLPFPAASRAPRRWFRPAPKTLMISTLAQKPSTFPSARNRSPDHDARPTSPGTEIIEEDRATDNRNCDFMARTAVREYYVFWPDEINAQHRQRRPGLVLEAMQERKVTAGRERHVAMTRPFFRKLATQNPDRTRGTYPVLPGVPTRTGSCSRFSSTTPSFERGIRSPATAATTGRLGGPPERCATPARKLLKRAMHTPRPPKSEVSDHCDSVCLVGWCSQNAKSGGEVMPDPLSNEFASAGEPTACGSVPDSSAARRGRFVADRPGTKRPVEDIAALAPPAPSDPMVVKFRRLRVKVSTSDDVIERIISTRPLRRKTKLLQRECPIPKNICDLKVSRHPPVGTSPLDVSRRRVLSGLHRKSLLRPNRSSFVQTPALLSR